MSAARKQARPDDAISSPAPAILGWLDSILEPRQRVELRAFGAGGNVQSRIYPPDQRAELVDHALRLSGRSEGVYFVLNPIAEGVSGSAKDGDITRRRRMLIDCDPARDPAAKLAAGDGAKLSATDAEKSIAFDQATDIREYLGRLGWPDPVRADSGNGWHLIYALDLPNDDRSRELVKTVLRALAHRFDTAHSGVDTVVFNASRVTKFYGTVARKGIATLDRPHRASRVLEIPEQFGDQVVSLEQLETLAALAPRANDRPENEPPPGAGYFAGNAGGNGRWTPEARAVAYLQKCDPAISGERGHNKALKAACKVGPGFDLQPDTAFRLLWEVYNPSCQPPWSEKDLRRKVDEAYRIETRRGWLLNEPRKGTGAERNGHAGKPPGNGNGQGGNPPGGEPAVEERPLIVCGSEHPDEGLKTWTPQALDALAATNRPKPSVFQRNGELCRLRVPIDLDDSPSIETLGFDALRGVMDRSASWGNVHVTRKGPTIRFGPPKVEIVKDVMALGSFDPEMFPALESIAESPVFAPDGRLIVEPGYHPEARLYYSPSPDIRGLEVSERPSSSEVRAAVSLLVDDLLCDFPFRNQASRANALAVMLLPFVRLMISGPTPNHHFTASTEGTGKGLCAAACAYPFLGRELAINAQKESEAEWRKALTSFLMSGGSHYFVDNLRNPLGWDDVPQDIESGVLAAAWTGIHWNDRILGGQDEARIKLHAVFMSSGNNVAFSRELTRRLVQVELVAVSENPSTRTGFKHGELKEWIRENRLALTRACLVLCRNWIAGGRIQGDQVMGSYESYARTMGGILAAAGISGFLENRPKVGKDRESQRWPALVAAWHEDRAEMATSCQMIYDLIFGKPAEGGRTGGIPELQVAFADVVGDGKELSRKQKLGHAIGKQDGRVWAGWRVVRTRASTNNGSPLYRLANPDEPDDAESSDEWSEGRV